MSRNEEAVLKIGTVLTLLGMLGAAIVMHFHGIETAYIRSKEYTDVRLDPIRKDVDDLKKKIDSIQIK